MCLFIRLKSDLFKRVFFFFMQGSVLLSVHHRSAPAPLLLPFGLSRWRSTRPAALSLVRGGVTWLLPPVQWHLPVPSSTRPSSAVSRSFTVPPCGLSAQPTRLLSVVRQGEGSFSCPIPLVLDNTGPGPQSPLDP